MKISMEEKSKGNPTQKNIHLPPLEKNDYLFIQAIKVLVNCLVATLAQLCGITITLTSSIT